MLCKLELRALCFFSFQLAARKISGAPFFPTCFQTVMDSNECYHGKNEFYYPDKENILQEKQN